MTRPKRESIVAVGYVVAVLGLLAVLGSCREPLAPPDDCQKFFRHHLKEDGRSFTRDTIYICP